MGSSSSTQKVPAAGLGNGWIVLRDKRKHRPIPKACKTRMAVERWNWYRKLFETMLADPTMSGPRTDFGLILHDKYIKKMESEFMEIVTLEDEDQFEQALVKHLCRCREVRHLIFSG
jgi:hypothetical protein